MKLHRALLAAVTAWLVVVAVGAIMVWAVISRAGEELVASDSSPGSESSATARTADPSTVGPGDPLRPRKSTTPTRPGSDGPSRGGSSGPGDGPATPTSPAGSSSGSQPSGPEPESATWSGAPGRVTVECLGSSITNQLSATPNGGWSVRVEREAGRVEVEFEQTSGNRSVELTAVCVGGEPRFSAEEKDGGGGDDGGGDDGGDGGDGGDAESGD